MHMLHSNDCEYWVDCYPWECTCAMKKPTIIEESPGLVKEHARAKFWRQHIARLSIDQLASLTGYSTRAVYLMELGCDAKGKKIRPWVWQRYKMACAGVHFVAVRHCPFDWEVK